MSFTMRNQALIWSIVIVVFVLALWLMGDVILPFIVGGAIAYFLDPVADRLEKFMSRALATTVIAVTATLIFVIAALAIVPLLVDQLTQLVQTAPQIFNQLKDFLTTQFPELAQSGSPVNEALVSIGQTIQERGGELASTLLSSAMGVVNFIVFIVVVPVVAFYMLLDWDPIVAKVDRMLPREHAATIRSLARDIDRVLSGFVRGQVTVCLILGTFYAVGLMLAGLNFGLIAGAIAGSLTFIPYVGAIIGGSLAIGLALFQFWGEWGHIAIVAAIFALGQFLEGNIITPKLVGNSIGLHPLWLIFALSAFGTLFGFVGMLVAVPVAAMLGVLARFGIQQYMQGPLYKGVGAKDLPPEDFTK
ncbi:AI-2E family transporter [Thioclava sp. GXIMD4216]|uniref:AI-2E family transporter n=1 Tax=Thioclava litoralis TaxID=3076557 RepID=A0ABZ1E134_9RHOB|nr:AI-2E family transporter [Thioclava sp. FTW29]